MRSLLVGLALLLAAAALVPKADAQFGVPLDCDAPDRNGDCAQYGVSMVRLLANPDKYDGKHIRVAGYIHFESGADALYLHKEDVDHHLIKNGVWVSLAEGVSFPECQDAYVVIQGIYQARNPGPVGLWSGAIRRVTKCEKVP